LLNSCSTGFQKWPASWFQRETLIDVEQALAGSKPIEGVKILKRLAERENAKAANH
jgi:hypothetical protein